MTRQIGSDRARQLAIRVLHWYPRPWRARYLQEMQALIEDMPVGWPQVANLAATAAREWLSPRALGWPSRSAAGRVQVARWLTFAAFAYALDGIARIMAWKLLAAGVTIPDGLNDDLALFMFVPLVRVFAAGACRLKAMQRTRFAGVIKRHDWLRYVNDWEVVVWLILWLPSLVVRHAMPIPSYYNSTMIFLKPFMDVYQVWVWPYLLLMNSSRTARLRRVQSSFLKQPWRTWRSPNR